MKAAGCVVVAKKIGLKAKLAKTSGAKMEEKKRQDKFIEEAKFIHSSYPFRLME